MTIALMIIRAVHFGSCLILQSAFVVLFVAAIPAWNRAGGKALAAAPPYCRLLRRLLFVSLFAAVASGFLWLWFAIAGMSGSTLLDSLRPDLFQMVLTETQPGRVWTIRAGLALVFGISLCFVAPSHRGWISATICALTALLLNASLAWLGHAGAGEGPEQNLQLTGDVLHLVTAGIWPAGLLSFAVFLRCFLDPRDPDRLFAACVATRRFSALSLAAVGVLTVSGFANGYFLVHTPRALVSTDYGRILLLKIALFVATITIGAWNLSLKSLLAMDRRLPLNDDPSPAALTKITRNVLIELGLVFLILLVTGLLGITAPANHS